MEYGVIRLMSLSEGVRELFREFESEWFCGSSRRVIASHRRSLHEYDRNFHDFFRQCRREAVVSE